MDDARHVSVKLAFVIFAHLANTRGIVNLRHSNRGLRESTVIPGGEVVRDLPWTPPEAFKQRLRMRRFLIASLFSVLYLLVVAIFSTQGKADRATLIEACAI